MRNCREVEVWDKTHQITKRGYTLTRNFPREEVYGLASQLRRAASSVPSNIAEGCGRNGDQDFVRFLDIALGSANEVDYQLLLCKDLGYVSAAEYEQLSHDVAIIQKMLTRLILKTRPVRPTHPTHT
jgi:four helix bundle protein